MKNKNLLWPLFGLLMLISACGEEEFASNPDFLHPSEKGLTGTQQEMFMLDPDPDCNITGDEIMPVKMQDGEIRSFTVAAASTDDISWLASGNLTIIGADDEDEVVVQFHCGSGLDTLFLNKISINNQQCSNAIIFECSPPPPPCICPDPKINFFDPKPYDPSDNCTKTSNDLYTVKLTGTESGDIISWSGNSNVDLQNGQGTKDLAFYVYDYTDDFVLTCTVTRNCGGSTFTRTATYGSNIAEKCANYAQYNGNCTGDLPELEF